MMENQSNPQARVTRRMSASPETVFDAWVNPERIRQWFAPGMGEMVRVETEAKVGGRFSFVQRRGGEEIDHTGEYVVVERPGHLAFTWGVPRYSADTSRVDVAISPLENGCEVTLTHQLHPGWADYVQRTEQSWAKMLDAMAGAIQNSV